MALSAYSNKSFLLLLRTSWRPCRFKLTKSLQGLAPVQRFLYTPANLGMTAFQDMRKRASVQFAEGAEDFKVKMKDVLETRENSLVFTEDLKNAIYLAEAGEEDVDMVLAMATRFNKQHGGLRFGDFAFGPQVMRLFFHLNQTQATIKALENEELKGFFDQMVTYKIAMNLLYDNGLYEEALTAFQGVQDRRIGGVRYPKPCFVIAVACYYKINSAESVDAALNLLESAKEYGFVVNRRQFCSVAALCLLQGRPQAALSTLAESTTSIHISVISIKVTALSGLGRVDDIVHILRSLTQIDTPVNPTRTNFFILQEAISRAEEAVARCENKEVSVEFTRIVKSLQEHNMISPKTIDDVVTERIKDYENNNNNNRGSRSHERERLTASFYPRERRTPHQRQQHHTSRSRPHRPQSRWDLMDME